MSWWVRIMLAAGGLLFIFMAHSQVLAGHLVFNSASYRQTTFAWSGYGIGASFILLALLPPSRWVSKRISTKKPKRRSAR
jgi:hypothetical protein